MKMAHLLIALTILPLTACQKTQIDTLVSTPGECSKQELVYQNQNPDALITSDWRADYSSGLGVCTVYSEPR